MHKFQQQCLQQTRSASSARRHKTLLRVKPAESFTNTTETQDHIIYNPPSSAPNVYHTPLAFLPKNDPRRKLHSLSSSHTPAAATKTPLPPPVRPVQEKKYHLTHDDIAEIKRLRAEDPRQWTRVRLAEKFGCSQFFVSLCCSAPEIKAERDAQLEAIKKRWGRAKREAREDRQTRKAMWGRGE
ncbi:hypothetical protein H2203_005068 [Taxawa tesnikishii (nom. ined.)]|nr:hypothetical protein H2203_005068 [Dothideales sp. JES 119]